MSTDQEHETAIEEREELQTAAVDAEPVVDVANDERVDEESEPQH